MVTNLHKKIGPLLNLIRNFYFISIRSRHWAPHSVGRCYCSYSCL